MYQCISDRRGRKDRGRSGTDATDGGRRQKALPVFLCAQKVRKAHYLLFWKIRNSSAHVIRNPALRASKLTIVSGLLINGRSAHKQSRMLIHASMIRLRDCLWLNCYENSVKK